ncbi:hypothetical protein PE067_09275 [Paracoccus sp. DMF-8]|uniref:hypothetical protein n=1 Tax=Paracoccus sp. DMF-8 TaxID=3019445 RepID=UPI0023E7E24F|nr:hypothetical protein [Paracoccus sp. DMF-8]MDF3606309.1 hypothetical protein [Paracoccus sp. DMF-8]
MSSVEVVLTGYWRDDMPAALRADVLADWCDELEDWPVESIKAALRKHRRENPNRKPNPGHIVALLKEAWGKRNAPVVAAALAAPVEAPKERVSDEARRAIMAEIGLRDPFAVNKMPRSEAAE